MQYEEFVEKVGELIGVEDFEEGEMATASTLATLGERISQGEAENLVAQLPEELKGQLFPEDRAKKAEGFSLEEFYDRVAVREDIDVGEAQTHARVVMSVLGEAVSGGELDDVKRQLPEEFYPLFEPGPTTGKLPRMDYREFIDRVERRMEEFVEEGYGLRSWASLATTSTLVTLGERITGGEASDLAARLPAELEDKLCGSHQEERAGEFSLGEFYRRVATREGIGPEEAAAHCRAVMRTLRESAEEKELDDLASQLPREFEPLFS